MSELFKKFRDFEDRLLHADGGLEQIELIAASHESRILHNVFDDRILLNYLGQSGGRADADCPVQGDQWHGLH